MKEKHIEKGTSRVETNERRADMEKMSREERQFVSIYIQQTGTLYIDYMRNLNEGECSL
jgi:hypothetical protein